MSDEVTTHQIEGVCRGVMLKGDWQEFHIDIGKQYPVKLASKHEDVKAQAAAAGEQKAVWTYTERDGNPNPHKPGEFFKNRYLSKVEVGGTLDPALAGQSSSSNAPVGGGVSGAQMPSSEGREQSIERQTIVKAIAPLYNSEGMTEDGFFSLLDRLDDWMGRKRAEQPQQAAEEQPPPPDDDDIPF